MKILCSGDRDWDDPLVIVAEFYALRLGPKDIVIHGNCRGADKMCGRLAAEQGATVLPYDADWALGKQAGPIRNRLMVKEHPDIELILAFHDHIDDSRGTADMLVAARLLRRKLVTHRGSHWLPRHPNIRQELLSWK